MLALSAHYVLSTMQIINLTGSSSMFETHNKRKFKFKALIQAVAPKPKFSRTAGPLGKIPLWHKDPAWFILQLLGLISKAVQFVHL